MTSDSKADAEKRRYLLRHKGRCNGETATLQGCALPLDFEDINFAIHAEEGLDSAGLRKAQV